MFKKAVKDFENGKVLFYYCEGEHYIDLISVDKYGEDDYGYWVVAINKSDINLKDIEGSLSELIHYQNKYSCEGFSLRATLEIIVDEVMTHIPTIEKDIKEIDSEFFVF